MLRYGIPEYRLPSSVVNTYLERLKFMGVKIDGELNDKMTAGREGKMSTPESSVPVWIISTNEELIIARDTKQIVEKLKYASTEDKTIVDPEDI